MNTQKTRLLLFAVVLIALNVLAHYFFVRLDLTEDHRFSISNGTQNLLSNLQSDVVVKVYLAGDMPAGFKRLQTAVQETLDEFKVYAGDKLTYRFINPDDLATEKERKDFYEEMLRRGMMPTNVVDNKGGKRTEKAVFPWAVVSADTLETNTLLLKGSRLASPQEQLNQSYEGVEFQLASAISQVTQQTRKRIGILNSVSSVPAGRLSDVIVSLQKKYDLFQVDLAKSPNLSGLDAILMVKPDVPFSEDDLFKLDQFTMHGGKALYFVDATRLDSLGREGTFAQPNLLRLDELFFKYGLRLNTNVVKDLELCAAIPLNVGLSGDKPNIQLMPWRFFPLLNNFGKSPIVRNLDAVYARFAGSIDTVQVPGVAKTPLLLTSAYTQALNAPVLVSYNEARRDPKPRDYNAGSKTIAYLLEGSFHSLFQNRILPSDPRSKDFVAQSPPTAVIVCADGDIPLNDWDARRNVPYPLGYDRYSQHTFANKDFVLNAVDYLLDDNGVITARTKEVALRPLDKIQLTEKRTFWQLLNLGLPLVLVAVLGLAWQAWQRKKYASS